MSKWGNRANKCPMHKIKMKPSKTRYGVRFDCPVDGCTMARWDRSKTSAADLETRKMRQEAHKAIDVFWRTARERKRLYEELSDFMGIPIEWTHIGFFDIKKCKKAIAFAKWKNQKILNKQGQGTIKS